MVIFFKVKLKELFKKGRRYPWSRPENCPCCGNYKVWGHGYDQAYFDGFNEPLWIKLYRCPDCGCVIRVRPAWYFKRFQAKIKKIYLSVAHKEKYNKWLSGISRTRQRHWLRALERKIKVYFGDTWSHGLLKAFSYFIKQGHLPVSRRI